MMESRRAFALSVLFILSILSCNFQVIYGDSSVVFLDSPTRQYLRQSPAKAVSLSPFEIGATASVLLGFAPPSTLSSASSSKLNEVLKPNPFDKPHAMLILEVTGAEDSQLSAVSDQSPISSGMWIKVEGNQRIDIHLPDEDEVSVVPLNKMASNTECTDQELGDFASWLGGSYVEDVSRPLTGELVIPVGSGAFLRLHMSEKADKEFATSLACLINNIRRAKQMHNVLKTSENSQAELITGRFDGIKALHDHYGKVGITQNGLEVFVKSISKIFGSLQDAYEGRIVGVIAQGGPFEAEQGNMFHVTTSRPSARLLQETEASTDAAKIAEVVFVRKTLAWLTGIILLIATILGIHFLMNMSLTKDTLLYSNVKLD